LFTAEAVSVLVDEPHERIDRFFIDRAVTVVVETVAILGCVRSNVGSTVITVTRSGDVSGWRCAALDALSVVVPIAITIMVAVPSEYDETLVLVPVAVVVGAVTDFGGIWMNRSVRVVAVSRRADEAAFLAPLSRVRCGSDPVTIDIGVPGLVTDRGCTSQD